MFQSADGYLVELATRYSTELRTNYSDVLQQLEDLRLAEWSDHAPPPPLAPGMCSVCAFSLVLFLKLQKLFNKQHETLECYGKRKYQEAFKVFLKAS